MPLALPKFSPHRNGEFSLYRKLYATEIKVDYSIRARYDVKYTVVFDYELYACTRSDY